MTASAKERVSRALEAGTLNRTQLRKAAGVSANTVAAIAAELQRDNYIVIVDGLNGAIEHASIRPYRGGAE